MENKMTITTTYNGETRTVSFDGAFVIGIDEDEDGGGYIISFINNVTIDMAMRALQQGIENDYVGEFITLDGKFLN